MDYLNLLDKSSSFELLVRLHYSDLQSIIIAHPELFRLTQSDHFRDRWKLYNIHTIEENIGEFIPNQAIVEVDRLGNRHGLARVGNKKTLSYVNGLLHGLEIDYHDRGKVRMKTYWHNGLKQGTSTHYRDDGSVYETIMFVNGKRHGPTIKYSAGEITWQEWFNGTRHGKFFEWYSNGGRSRESTTTNGILDGIHRHWNNQGQLRGKYINTSFLKT
jgi:hypothetical protein